MNSLKETNNKKTNILYIGLAFLIYVAFFLILNNHFWSGTSMREGDGTREYKENPWVLKQGEEILNSNLVLPEYLELEKDKIYTLSTTITYDGKLDKAPYAFLHLDHLFVRVWLEDDILFSYMPEDLKKWDQSKSPGFIFKAFSMPEDCKGKTMTIELLPKFSVPTEYGLPEIEFGDYSTTVRKEIFRDVPHDILTVICVFMGLLTIMFATLVFQGKKYREELYIGIFALFFSIYMLTECNINVYYIANPYYIYLLNFISFSMGPFLILGYMKERLVEKHKKICKGIMLLQSILILVEFVFHFSGIMDMREFVFVVHVNYVATPLILGIFLFMDGDKEKKKISFLQVLPIVLGMIADIYIYWKHIEVGENDAPFTIIGVLIFLFMELFRIWKATLYVYTESAKSAVYRQLAYTDALTQVGNRYAYDDEINDIIEEKKEYDSMIVVSMDVNKLKYVNDHFGHFAGDTLIRSVAQIIESVLDEKGRIFRTGGDEFAVFLYDISIEKYHQMREIIQKRIEEFNENNEFVMSLASGYVEIKDHKILEAVRLADEKMYQDKAKSKKKNKI